MKSGDEISEKWIENIKKLDNKNNLKHGEFYAKDGNVHDLEIDNNTVISKVTGKPGYVYNVKIVFDKLSSRDIDFLKKYIASNPVIYSKLLNNKVPEELFTTKVKLLPDSLRDFKMSCSCEKGLFCKHKAAVFHKLAIEISKKPFLIFSLRGFDINDLIRANSYKIKSIRNILKKDNKITLNNSNDNNYLDKLAFSLAEYPSFYPSDDVDFNQVLYETLKAMPKCINRIIHPKTFAEFHEYISLGNTIQSYSYKGSLTPQDIKIIFESKWGNPQKWSNFKIDLNGIYDIIRINTGTVDNYFAREDLKLPLFAFFAELSQINGFNEYCSDVQFLYKLFLFTSHLISQNAFIPDFFRLDNKEYHIRWIPVFEERFYSIIDQFAEKCPNNLLTFYETKLPKRNQIINLISLFFEGFAQYYVFNCMPHKLDSFKNESFFRLFFTKSQDLSNYVNKGKEIEIDNWLSALWLNQNDYKLILETKQKNEKFDLCLVIQIEGKNYTFDDIVNMGRVDIIKNLVIIQNIFKRFDVDYDFSAIEGMDLRQYSGFLDEIEPALRVCGVEVTIPDEFESVKSAKLILDIKTKGDVTSSLSLSDLVDFDWKIAVGEKSVSIDDFKTFTHNFRGLVKIKDKYYFIEEDILKELQAEIEKIPKDLNNTNILNYLLSSSSDNIIMDSRIENLIEEIFNVPEINVPQTLNGELRPYQETGYSWLVQNLEVGFGSILADDMGLGKTIQVLSLILYLKENDKLDGRILIVAPTSILTNWAMEIEKFAPSLKIIIYHGVNRYFPEEDFDILLTSFGILRADVDYLNKRKWFLFVVDEAQNIKNPDSKQTKAVKQLKANHHIALSGTPIENHLGEYWSIFDFTNKGYLGTLSRFKDRYLRPIQYENNARVLKDFKRITSPFILRRLKTDKTIIKELPDKMVNDIYCNLSVKQAAMYDEALDELIKDVEDSSGIQRKGLVLKLINSLKQICNHPAQYLKSEEAKVSESGKMEVLMNILETILESGEKTLIFTQYVKMGEIIKELLEEKFSEEVLFLHGGVTRKNRDEMIRQFQQGDTKIFILSLRAGGIGLNLTAATNVIHYDLWWNPAVENQATDRAYRIGQTENVMVYRFITRGTLEESINQILLEKRELVDNTIGEGESFITEMSNEELKEMLYLKR